MRSSAITPQRLRGQRLAIATRQKCSVDWRRFTWRKSVITTGKFSYDCSVDHSDHPKEKKFYGVVGHSLLSLISEVPTLVCGYRLVQVRFFEDIRSIDYLLFDSHYLRYAVI